MQQKNYCWFKAKFYSKTLYEFICFQTSEEKTKDKDGVQDNKPSKEKSDQQPAESVNVTTEISETFVSILNTWKLFIRITVVYYFFFSWVPFFFN